MLTIRLSRIGKKKKPIYRLIISEKTKDPYGRALEILGTYNPFSKELVVKKDRINYWLSKGSGISPTANNLLIENKIIQGEKMTASKKGKKKKAEEESKNAKTEKKPEENKNENKEKVQEEPKMAETEEKAEETVKEEAKITEKEQSENKK